MKLHVLNSEFSVCKIQDTSQIDFTREFCFVGKTDEEISLVCETKNIPANVLVREDGWKAFRIQGVLDFSLIGILSKITTILAEHKIGVFAVSTYNTDYVLTKSGDFDDAIEALRNAGYQIG